MAHASLLLILVLDTRRHRRYISLAMSTYYVLLLAFAIGIVSGLRSLTAPAVVAIFTLLAVVELVTDKLPNTPSRTKLPGLLARIVFGAISGAAVCEAGGQSIVFGWLLGAAGGVAGAFAGYQWRTGLVKALQVPDFVIALLEDAIAIGGGLFIVSRF
jgi:uncharacterized membrane protein